MLKEKFMEDLKNSMKTKNEIRKTEKKIDDLIEEIRTRKEKNRLKSCKGKTRANANINGKPENFAGKLCIKIK